MLRFPKIFFLFFLLEISGSSYPWQNESVIAKQKEQIDSVNAQAEMFLGLSAVREAQNLLENAAARAKTIGYKKGEGIAYIGLSNVAYFVRNFLAAEKYGLNAVNLFNQFAPDTLLAKAWIVWAKAVWAQSRFDEAIGGFEKARQISDNQKDSTGTGDAYSLIALAEEERGNYEKSFQYSTKALQYKNQSALIAIGQLYADVGDYDAALEYYSRVTDRSLDILNYMKIGEAYFLKSNHDSALFFYQRYLNSIQQADIKAYSKPYILLGELYLSEKKYDSAVYYLENALKGFRDVNDRNWVMRSLLELAKTYKENGQAKTAVNYARELLNNAKQTGARQYARDAHYLLYELFDTIRNTDSAYSHFTEFARLTKAIDIDLSARKLAFFKASAELEQAALKIDLLNRQKQLQQEEIKQSNQQKLFLLSGVVVIVIIFIILARNFFLKKRNAEHLKLLAEKELQIEKIQHNKKQAELEMQMLRVQMNPHFIFNSLNSISRFILNNNKSDADEYLTKFSRLVRMILQNSRSTVITLEDELASLHLYLELEKLRFDNQFAFSITIDESVDTVMLKIPPLVVQPFVENAIWHGIMPKKGTGHVAIHVTEDPDFLLIKITDDGVGRAAALRRPAEQQLHQSLGIQTTSQRIKMIHSTGDISPVDITDLVDNFGTASGTEVTLKLPLLYD